MRRAVFLGLGGLELLIAALLVHLGLALPRPRELHQGFDQVEQTTRNASRQVDMLRRQVGEIRRPEMQELADKLQKQTGTVTTTMKRQQVDFDTVVLLQTSLRDTAAGLDGLAESIDPARMTQLGQGLTETAKFIDQTMIPASTAAADKLDETAALMTKDGKNLAELLKSAPPDLKIAREIHDSLARFDDGLDAMLRLLELKRIEAIKEGFSGLETSLSTTASEIERVSGYKYPRFRLAGLKVEMEEKPFWPNGDKIADGLRKATEGVRAAQKELDNVSGDLPRLRKSLEESRKIVAKTREALGQALKQQDKLEPLLRDMPTRTAQLAESLPKLAQELAKILRETKHLQTVATALRQTQKGLDVAAQRWPEIRTGLKKTAELLKLSSSQLNRVLQNRQEYETALQQSTELAETFSRAAPLFTVQVNTQLAEQEKALLNLEKSLDKVGDTLPAYQKSATDTVATGRLLTWLIALAVALHGVFLLSENFRRPRS